MPWPQKPRIIGTKVQRLDGPEKATGRARYTYDINRPGMLHAKILRCPHAHARIRTIDTAAAQKVPGFKAIYNVAKPGQEIFYAGTEILGIACDTEEHCDDAIHAVRIDYEVLPHQVREEDARRNRKQGTAAAGLMSNVSAGKTSQSAGWNAKVFDGLTVHEGDYGLASILHQSLETHGIVCEFDEKLQNLTVWSSTQSVTGTANGLAMSSGIPAAQIKSITHYMGGGFGSKFGTEVENNVCAALARSARAPVKLMLDRSEESIKGGMRPSAYAKVKIGATKQGDIRAFEAAAYGSAGSGTGFNVLLPYVYQPAIPNYQVSTEIIRLNTQPSRAWRAPAHPQSCTLTDQPLDDLAARLNINPMDFRLRNLPANAGGGMGGGQTWASMRRTVYTRQINLAREVCQWDKKWHAPGAGAGPIKMGIGMAIHTWAGAGQAQPNDVRVTISNDGSVLVQSSTQDLGTGNRTVLAIVAAEILGLEVKDITVRLGESPFGASTASGGSSTCPSVAPITLVSATAARDSFLAAVAGPMGTAANNLRIEPGVVVNTTNNNRVPWRQACAMLGTRQISENRRNGGNDANTAQTGPAPGGGVGGVQIAEVKVDTETGVVRCLNFWTVQDCGLIVNRLCCESQVTGGIIMGLNGALFEERVMDGRTGRQCNADMEFYKLGCLQDMPNIHVHMMDMPERGVIGIGEPPTVSTVAAVGNAVFNAIGKRVPHAPFTPERVLAALAAK